MLKVKDYINSQKGKGGGGVGTNNGARGHSYKGSAIWDGIAEVISITIRINE